MSQEKKEEKKPTTTQIEILRHSRLLASRLNSLSFNIRYRRYYQITSLQNSFPSADGQKLKQSRWKKRAIGFHGRPL